MTASRILHSLFPEYFFRLQLLGVPSVPAYFYHQVEESPFRRICEALARHQIRTITFNEWLNGNHGSSRKVMLTFDDGWSSTWSVAFPLACRYGLRFTLFAVPSLMEDSAECRSTLTDGEDPQLLVQRDFSDRCFLTWGEIRAMHRSGVVEVQSHSLHHGVVFSSNRLTGFCGPQGPFPLHRVFPLVSRIDGTDAVEFNLPLGTPLHPWLPALATERRFLANPELRQHCAQYVEGCGGLKFFSRLDWQEELGKILKGATIGTWETEEERHQRISHDLLQAKKILESRIEGLRVRAIAPPWGEAHADVSTIANQTGHEVCVLAYPPRTLNRSSLPLYPRLFGDAIWNSIEGPLVGAPRWWLERRRSLKRKATGAIP